MVNIVGEVITIPLVATVWIIIIAALIAIAQQVKYEKAENDRGEQERADERRLDGWLAEAKERGEEVAVSAATWVVDDCWDRWHYEALLAKVQRGDHEPWELPSLPNLSGEFAGDPTPQRLYHEVVNPNEDDLLVDERHGLEGELAEAWEEGRDEMFLPSIELILMEALEGSVNVKTDV